jgi:hypothetical protein
MNSTIEELRRLIAEIEQENEVYGWNNKDNRTLSDSSYCPTLGALRRFLKALEAKQEEITNLKHDNAEMIKALNEYAEQPKVNSDRVAEGLTEKEAKKKLEKDDD